MALLDTKKGVRLISLPGQLLASPEHKDALSTLLVDLIQREKAIKVALVFSVWYLSLKRQATVLDINDLPLPSTNPDRREAVSVMVMDAERTEMWMADIRRRVNAAPLLNDWREIPQNVDLTGRFIEPLQNALR